MGALDLFRIGIGPSSSHTVGPMRAAHAFATELEHAGVADEVDELSITLYGSLGATGPGHGTPSAIVAGLAGLLPESCDPIQVSGAYQAALELSAIKLGNRPLPWSKTTIKFSPLTRLDKHSNGMRFVALSRGEPIYESVFLSVGGGFIEKEGENIEDPVAAEFALPHTFSSASQLIERCIETDLTIAALQMANDAAVHGQEETTDALNKVWSTMVACIESGLSTEGVLPGTLGVPRRAKGIADKLGAMTDQLSHESDWLQAFAIAVNEENAAGHRVVTAPTNGAAGIIPAVGYWGHRFHGISSDDLARIYLPTAAAIGALYKNNASISGAEAGCQGEVGSACSMAAAGITAVMGGSPAQIENAAEIAMEHNLGLTCDPVGGYVQLPCIERNAIAAGTALSAMRLALLGDGTHKISLDTVIETMRQTGVDMSSKYKETSMGGLAVNVIEC